MDIQYYILDYNFSLGIQFQFLFFQRRAITNSVYIITSIFYNNNMYNVVYYVHITILMCNILYIICFYFSLHNIYIIWCYTNIAYFFTDFYAISTHFPTDFYARSKHKITIYYPINAHQITFCCIYIFYVFKHNILNLHLTLSKLKY